MLTHKLVSSYLLLAILLSSSIAAHGLPSTNAVLQDTDRSGQDVDVLAGSLSDSLESSNYDAESIAEDFDIDLEDSRGEKVKALFNKVKSLVTKEAPFKLPDSIRASWKAAGCRSAAPASCGETCRVYVATAGASVNPATKHNAIDIAINLQAAVNLAHEQAVKHNHPSCSVILPKGTFTISQRINVLSRVHIMGNSATIVLPHRNPLVPSLAKFFPAFQFQGSKPADPLPEFSFTQPLTTPVGPGDAVTLPATVAAAAAKLLLARERVVLHAVLHGVPDLTEFENTQHDFLYEHYDSVVKGPGGWAQNPLGFYVEVLSVNANVAKLRSTLPYQFGKRAFTLTLIPGSKLITNAALTDIILSRPPMSDDDVKIVQANSCDLSKNDSQYLHTCKHVKKLFESIEIGYADMIQLAYALDVNIARNRLYGIIRSGAVFEHTLHSCFNDNVVTDARIFADTGAGQGDGIILSSYASYNSVVTNSFSKLRHAILLQFGANSNVVANNKNEKVRCQLCRPSPMNVAAAAQIHDELKSHSIYNTFEKSLSRVIFQDVESVSRDSLGTLLTTACVNVQYEHNDSVEFSFLGKKIDWCADVSFHGLYANNNLIEGNDVETIKIADYFGPSPSNVIFGNRINARSLSVVVDRASTDTVLVDNLFMDGGFTFLDDASSVTCTNNKQCTLQGASCLFKQSPEFHDIDLFKSTCALFNSRVVQDHLDMFANTKLGRKMDLVGKIKSAKGACSYFDRVLGGRDNKDSCEDENSVVVGPRPLSLFSDKTMKACSDMLPKCFENMRGPAAQLTCPYTSQSRSDVQLDSSDDDVDFMDDEDVSF